MTTAQPEERGYVSDGTVYQNRLDAIGFAEAFMRNDRAYYDVYLATRDPYRLAHALAYVCRDARRRLRGFRPRGRW